MSRVILRMAISIQILCTVAQVQAGTLPVVNSPWSGNHDGNSVVAAGEISSDLNLLVGDEASTAALASEGAIWNAEAGIRDFVRPLVDRATDDSPWEFASSCLVFDDVSAESRCTCDLPSGSAAINLVTFNGSDDPLNLASLASLPETSTRLCPHCGWNPNLELAALSPTMSVSFAGSPQAPQRVSIDDHSGLPNFLPTGP